MTDLGINSGPFRPTGDPSSDVRTVQRRLRLAWRVEQAVEHLRGVGDVALVGAAIAWAMLLLDWWLELATIGRLVMLGLAVATVAAVAFRRWLRRLERFDSLAWALRLERAEPRLRSLVVSALQLDGSSRQASPTLVAAMQRQAAEAVAAVRIGKLVDASPLRRAGITWPAAALLIGLAAAGFGDYFGVLAHRMTNPSAATAYPTLTRIADVSGDRLVRRGEPLTLEAAARGLTPIAAELKLRAGDQEWESITLRQGPGQRYAHRFGRVVRGFEYRFVIGDAASNVHRVRVAAAPSVVATRVTLEYPDYMDRPDDQSEALSLTVPRGTTVRWRLRFDRPVRAAQLLRVKPTREASAEAARAQTEPLTETKIGADGLTMSAAWPAERSVRYALRVVDAEHGMTHPRTLMHRLDVIDDAPPSVQWLGADARSMVGTIDKRLDLRFRVSDDHGVAASTLVYAVNEGVSQRLSIAEHGGDRVDEGVVRYSMRKLDPGVEPGDAIKVVVEAVDVRPGDQPVGVGRSEPIRLGIVTEAAYQHRMDARLDEAIRDIEAARADGASIRDALRPLRPRGRGAGVRLGAADESTDKEAGRIAELLDAAASLQRRLAGLSERLRSMAGDLRSNGLYNAAGGGRLDRMARLLDRAASRHLRAGLAAIRAARDGRGELRSAIDRADEQLAAGMDLIDRLLKGSGRRQVRSRLAAEARRLTEAQWRMRERLSEWGRAVIAGDTLADETSQAIADQQRSLQEAMAQLTRRIGEAAERLTDRSLRRAEQEAQFDPPDEWASQALAAIQSQRPVAAAEAADRAMRAAASLAAILWENAAQTAGLSPEEAYKRAEALLREQVALNGRLEGVGPDGPRAPLRRLGEAQGGLARVCEALVREMAEATTVKGAEPLEAAIALMRRAERSLRDGAYQPALQAQKRVLSLISQALAELGNGGARASEADHGMPRDKPPGWLRERIAPSGADGDRRSPPWDRATWQTLYSQYLEDLPMEYRGLLEDYYEVLSE